jgi:estrogen-related receptor beta like 1
MEPFAHSHTRILLQAKTNLKRLEKAHAEHDENATNLSDDLQCLSEELDLMKKKLDGQASSVSDATPLVEIRAAIQRLRKENKELDVYLGVLVSNSFWIE